ncbi:DEAD/DEAH box helicase [Rhodocaloribacter sp.]
MIILHIGVCDDQLFLWGEAPPDEPRETDEAWRDAASPPSPERLPYDAAAEAPADACAEAGIRIDVNRAVRLNAWLPTRGRIPLPSSPLVAEVLPDGAEPALVAWGITALPLSTEEAIRFLGACMNRSMLAPGVLLGGDVIFWTKVLRFAASLVAREQFLPGLAERDGVFRACWEPVFTGEDAGRPALLAGAMPHACRALTRMPAAPPDAAPAAVLSRVTGAFVDYLVRTAWLGRPLSAFRMRKAARGSFASVHDQWLHALRTWDAAMDGDVADLAHLAGQIEAWRRPVSVSSKTPFRLTFRLEEPEETEPAPAALVTDPGPWRVRYLLQATDDPSLFVEVAEAWEPGPQTASIFAKHRFNVQEYLLASLGRAASLYPAIEESLKQPRPGGFALDTGGAHTFLTETAWLLRQAGYGVQLPAWWTRAGARRRLSARATVTSPKMQGGSGLSLDTIVSFDWQVALGDERLSREEMEALARLKTPLVKVRGQWVQVDDEAIREALDFWKKKGEAQVTVREVVQMALGTAQAPGGLPFEGVEATGWVEELLRRLEHGATVEELPPPERFEGTLRPYQARGYAWLAFLQRWGFGACLADDMGLGKTPQTLALIQHNREQNGKRPVLVVCPTSVMGNWKKEAARFTPDLPVLLHHGTRRVKDPAAFKKEAQAQAVVITGYPLLHRDFDLFKRIRWGAVILDEAQNIKNPGTKQARAARSLKADHRIALTGTPVENNVGELWSIMEFLNPGFLGSQAEFKRQFFVPIQIERDPEAARRLKRLTGPFILRRLKTDKSIIDDLPEKLEMNVFTTLTKEQASLYRAVVKETNRALDEAEGIQRKGLVLATLMKLKQICNHPAQFLHDRSAVAGRSGKLARLTEMLEEVYEVGDRALIFTQFTEMGEMIRRHLQETFGREVLFLHGGTPRKRRERMVERFQEEKDGPLCFLLSLKAGGTGLNLTRANHVFHFDRWWNPAVENQATDRAFRIGQTRRVQVHKFVCIGTVEERINEMIERKREIAESIVGAGEEWITELSTRDLKKLFRLRKEAVGG